MSGAEDVTQVQPAADRSFRSTDARAWARLTQGAGISEVTRPAQLRQMADVSTYLSSRHWRSQRTVDEEATMTVKGASRGVPRAPRVGCVECLPGTPTSLRSPGRLKVTPPGVELVMSSRSSDGAVGPDADTRPTTVL